MYPPFANAMFGLRADEIAEVDAAICVPYPPAAEAGEVVVHRMRVTGKPWREMIRWKRIVCVGDRVR